MKFKLLIFVTFYFSTFIKAQNIGHGYEFDTNGKTLISTALESTYTLSLAPVETLRINDEVNKALISQKKYLQKNFNKKSFKIADLEITYPDLIKVVEVLQSDTSSVELFNFYQIQGEDGYGNVHFTGYFVPVIKARSQKDSVFKYPIYMRPSVPNHQIPDRYAIDFQNALANQNLELAYTSNLLENYFMQVQGSGMIQYQNGKTQLLSYGGTNGKSYTSIGKYLITTGQASKEEISLNTIRKYFDQNPDSIESILSKNKSYTFFVKNQEQPVGAANVPLTSYHSIAVDPSVIPIGSVLLAKVPILDTKSQFLKHDYRILFAQDTGGAIKGSGHVDIYLGIGNEAEKKASGLHHYGELWLILPKN